MEVSDAFSGHTIEFHEQIEPSSIAILSGTSYPSWYPGELQNIHPDTKTDEILLKQVSDKIRGDLAIASFRKAKEKGYQLSVVDVGSSPEFQNALSDLKIPWNVQTELGISESRRQALLSADPAANTKYIVWTEPEKVNFIEHHLQSCLQLLRDTDADIVVPKRSEISKKSYPPDQMESEEKANKTLNHLLRARGLLKESDEDLDLMFGPRVFKNTPELRKLFLRKFTFTTDQPRELQSLIRPEHWNNFVFFPVISALYDNYKVLSKEIDYIHPSAQSELEVDTPVFEKKRYEQRTGITAGAVYLLDYLIGNNPRNAKGRLVEM